MTNDPERDLHEYDESTSGANAAMERFISEVAEALLSFDYDEIARISTYNFIPWLIEANRELNEADEPKYAGDIETLMRREKSVSIIAKGLAADFAEWIAEDDDSFFTKLDNQYRMEQDNG